MVVGGGDRYLAQIAHTRQDGQFAGIVLRILVQCSDLEPDSIRVIAPFDPLLELQCTGRFGEGQESSNSRHFGPQHRGDGFANRVVEKGRERCLRAAEAFNNLIQVSAGGLKECSGFRDALSLQNVPALSCLDGKLQ